MKINKLIFALIVFVSACSQNSNNTELEQIMPVANSRCILSIEGMMCEKGCKSTIQQRLASATGVVSCQVEYENKKAILDFDHSLTSPQELIAVVDEIAGGIYKASLLEESVYKSTNTSDNNFGGEDDNVSVADYGFQLPDFTSFFSNFI